MSCHLEFKEIRKEWKARKKEEDLARKAEGDRQRSSMGAQSADGNSTDPSATAAAAGAQTPTTQAYAGNGRPQLPPIGYPQGGTPVSGQYQAGTPDQMYSQSNSQLYSTYPHSPYNSSGQVYQQREWSGAFAACDRIANLAFPTLAEH